MWMAVRFRENRISTQDFNLITKAIPNRLNYFDGIVCDLFPFQNENATSINELDKEEENVVAYPNPTTDFVKLKLDDAAIYRAIIYNSLGNVVLDSYLRTDQNIDLSEFPNGVYFLVLHNDGKKIKKKIMKY